MNYFSLLYPILSLVSFYTIFLTPQFAIFLLFLSPLFLLIYMEKEDRSRKTDIVSFIIFLGTSFLDPLQSLYFIPMVLIPVVILWRNRLGLLGGSYMAPVVGPLPLLALITFMLTVTPEFRAEIEKLMLEFVANLTAPFENSPERFTDAGTISYILANKERAAYYLTYLLPAASYMLVSVYLYIIDRLRPLFVDGFILKRDFRMPDWFVWMLIAGGFLILFKYEPLRLLSFNILIIFGILYFFQGLQLMLNLFDKFKVSRIFRLLIYFFLFTEPPVIVVLSLFGLFSIWYRPKWSQTTEE